LPTTLRLFYEKRHDIGQTGKNAPDPALSFSDKRIITVDFQEMLKHCSTMDQVLLAALDSLDLRKAIKKEPRSWILELPIVKGSSGQPQFPGCSFSAASVSIVSF
jgi:glutaredoxin-related protein